MRKLIKRGVILIIIITVALTTCGFSVASAAGEKVYLCGFAAGFEVKTKGVSIIKATEVVTENGVVSPSKDVVDAGDRLIRINDVDINCAEDVDRGLSSVKGGEVVLTLVRRGETLLRNVSPAKDVGGVLRLGLLLKDGVSGIGTMTFIKRDGTFMALGHPICSDDGEILDITEGEIFRCSLFGVNKAEYGKAGELKGMIIGDSPIGVITENLEQGIKGKMDGSFKAEDLILIETGEARPGKATIVTCVDGVIPKEYDVSLVKVDEDKSSKNFVVKVTDKDLIEVAGGIVQGMSGSPIIQGGKLVGSLTHVFISDSTRGYGISIDSMLAA